MGPRSVLFLCVENSCRSLMAESMFNADPPLGWRATSAGTRPAETPNPRTGDMLREIGLTLPGHRPQLLTTDLLEGAGVRVTMGCLDDASCPAQLKSLQLRDWALPDPAKLDDEGFRQVRDRLQKLVQELRIELSRPTPSELDPVEPGRR
jgi:arsenate reductase (thioredoxin)